MSPRVIIEPLSGEPDIHPIEAIRLDGHPEIITLSVDLTGELDDDDPRGSEIIGHIPWHSDLTYTATPSRGAPSPGPSSPSFGAPRPRHQSRVRAGNRRNGER